MKRNKQVAMLVLAGSICIGCGIGIGVLIQKNHQLEVALSQEIERENSDKQIVTTDEAHKKEEEHIEESTQIKDPIDPNATYKQLATELEIKYKEKKVEEDAEDVASLEKYNQEEIDRYVSDPSSYLLSDSNIRKIDYYEVSHWSKECLALARNEIYARHGYNFEKENYKQVFAIKEWYTPLYTLDQIVLSEVEKYNITFLEWMEKVQKNTSTSQESYRGFSDVYCFNAGESFKMDLNNDGIKEEIVMELQVQEEDYRSTCQVKVNGEVQVELERNWDDYIWVVDIDETDGFKELVLYDQGPSFDPEDYYYYYNGKELVSMGIVVGHINDAYDKVRNYIENGILHGAIRSDILGTTWYNWDYKLNSEHMLEEIPCGAFKVNIPIIATEDINIYSLKSLSSKSMPYKAGTYFTAIGTDLNEWIEVKLEDGSKGWINVSEYPSYKLGGLAFAD